MPRCIHKFKLEINDNAQHVPFRSGGKFLAAGMQNGELCIWVEHDTDNGVGGEDFRVFGTGHPIVGISGAEWRATVQAPPFVWHVYEL